jgi:hypothetical protein
MNTHELVIKAFCEGFKVTAEEREKYGVVPVDIGRKKPTHTDMKVNVPPMHQLAEAYGINRTYVYQLRERLNLTQAELSDPDAVFSALLSAGRGCPLRTRLADPATRQAIKQSLP